MWLGRVKRRVSEDLFEIMWICNKKVTISCLQCVCYHVWKIVGQHPVTNHQTNKKEPNISKQKTRKKWTLELLNKLNFFRPKIWNRQHWLPELNKEAIAINKCRDFIFSSWRGKFYTHCFLISSVLYSE